LILFYESISLNFIDFSNDRGMNQPLQLFINYHHLLHYNRY